MAFASMLAMMASFVPGSRLVDGGDCLQLAKLTASSQGSMVALAGGGQTLAAGNSNLCQYYVNEFGTVASGGDSAILPPAIPGVGVLVINDGANSMNLFGYPGVNPLTGAADQTIPTNSPTLQAGSTAIAVASGHALYFEVVRPGVWKQLTA